jgi:ABC-type lipoprotein release transport system permease subunit
VGVLEPTGTEYDKMAFSPAFMPDLQGGDHMPARFRSWGTDSMGDVFRLFFSEALLLGRFGALLGVGISVLLSKLMESALGFERISTGVLAAGIVGAWVLTMVLTVYPALQAARVPAAQAIRNE